MDYSDWVEHWSSMGYSGPDACSLASNGIRPRDDEEERDEDEEEEGEE